MSRNLTFEQILQTLLDEQAEWKNAYVHPLSDLEGEQAARFDALWPEIPPARKVEMLSAMENEADDNTLLSFEHVCRLAIADPDPQVRFLGVRAIEIYEPDDLIETLCKMVVEDPDENVRAVTAATLGRFVYLGEIEAIAQERYQLLHRALLEVARSEDTDAVRRNALEALGYSGDPQVDELIEEAYARPDTEWQISSLFAMGRSYNKRWHKQVLEALDHRLPLIRSEAARAAGELEIQAARPRLIELLDDPTREVRMAAAWSLSQIGGEGVRAALLDLQSQNIDDEEYEFLEDVLDNLTFNQEFELFNLLEIDLPDDLEDDFDLDLRS